MPIRINLLAEDQALEEERRRDPVKRTIVAAAIIAAGVLSYTALLQVKIFSSRSELNQLQAQWNGIAHSYQQVVDNQREVIKAEQKLLALQEMVTNRFLWGNVLNALQHCMDGIDDIYVVRFKSDQAYLISEEVKARTNNTTVIPGKPATSKEKIAVVIDAIDASAQPGGVNVNKFKHVISQAPYFQENLAKTNGVLLTSMSAPYVGPNNSQPYVTFSLQCFFPEKVR